MEVLENDILKIIIRPDNIVEVHTKETWDQPDTVETAIESALLVKKAIDGKRRATLSFLASTYVQKEVVVAYNSIDTGQIAGALVVQSFGAKLLGNLALKFTKMRIPAKLFNNKKDAEAWLKQLLEEEK